MPANAVIASICLTLGALLLLTTSTESVPYSGHRLFSDLDNEPEPEVMLELLARLGQSIMRANELEKEEPRAGYEAQIWPGLTTPNRGGVPMLVGTKRGLDLGLSRGFSGSQAARLNMGLAAANFAGGPGRRRRQL